jgi:hypothetical protein
MKTRIKYERKAHYKRRKTVCDRVTNLQKRGTGRRGSGEMRERIQCDDGCHSNCCYEEVERTPSSTCLAYLLIFRTFTSPLLKNSLLFILENYFTSLNVIWYSSDYSRDKIRFSYGLTQKVRSLFCVYFYRILITPS